MYNTIRERTMYELLDSDGDVCAEISAESVIEIIKFLYNAKDVGAITPDTYDEIEALFEGDISY